MAQITKITSNSRQILKALEAVPGAVQKMTAATLTETAHAVTTRSERNIKREMIVRTSYTTKSLVTYKASATKPIERQNAVAGTKSEYLPVQDQGGKIKARKKVIAVPTNKVRGADRRKKVPARYRLDKMGDLKRDNPGKLFVLPSGIYYRKGKPLGKAHWAKQRRYERMFGAAERESVNRPMVRVRSFTPMVKVKARKWHSEAVGKYGTYDFMARRFEANAKRYLAGKWR